MTWGVGEGIGLVGKGRGEFGMTWGVGEGIGLIGRGEAGIREGAGLGVPLSPVTAGEVQEVTRISNRRAARNGLPRRFISVIFDQQLCACC
jgi:hypothetical protein